VEKRLKGLSYIWYFFLNKIKQMLFVRKQKIIILITVPVLAVLGILYMINQEGIISERKENKTVEENQTQYRLILDELYLLQDQSHMNSKDFLKAHVSWKKFEDKLESKKRAYNISFVNLFKKYGIRTDNLYNELDLLWDKAEEKDRKAFMEFAATTVPPSIVSTSAMNQGWDCYLQGTKQIAHQHAKNMFELSKNDKQTV